MMGVAKQYVQLELPAFALTCLTLMPHSEKRHQQIKVPCWLFLYGCQYILLVPQKRAFSFHQTHKAGILSAGEAGEWEETRLTEVQLRDVLKCVWPLFCFL